MGCISYSRWWPARAGPLAPKLGIVAPLSTTPVGHFGPFPCMGLGSPRVAKGGDPYRDPNGATQDILFSNKVHRLQTILAMLHMGIRVAKLRFWVQLRL
jgi:hypothetical protein